jgi:hypothetical protein
MHFGQTADRDAKRIRKALSDSITTVPVVATKLVRALLAKAPRMSRHANGPEDGKNQLVIDSPVSQLGSTVRRTRREQFSSAAPSIPTSCCVAANRRVVPDSDLLPGR